MEMALILSFGEPEKSWQPAKRLGTLFVNLLFLVTFVTLVFVSTRQKFLFVPPDHFGEVLDLECVVQLSGKKQASLTQATHDSFVFPHLNSLISLNNSEIYRNLNLATSLDDVSLFNRPSSTQGESTSEELTQSDYSERFDFDEEMDMLMRNLDLDNLQINPSPTSGDFLENLSYELQSSDSDQSLLDLFGTVSQKSDIIYEENCKFDFTAGHLIPERLEEFGMKNDVLDFVKSGIPVQLDSPLFPGDIKTKRNSKNVKKNCNVVRKLLGDLEEAGHIEKVNFKPLVVSPLNLVPKSNGSPRLIHNLKLFNRFVKRGPSVKHLNVLNIAKSEFSSKTYFCKLDLSNGYFHLSIRPEDRTYFGFSFENCYYVFNSLCFGYKPAPDFFQAFSQELVRIFRNQGILCRVELDDFLIYADSFQSCLNSVNLAVQLFNYFGLKVNFAKSSLIPSQRIDFLGYSLDARDCCFSLTQDKLFKCRLIVKCLTRLRSISVKLLQRILGFLNFAFQLFPFGRSFIRSWYKLASNSASFRVKLDPSPLAHLRDVFFKGPLFAFWPSGVVQPSLPCFVDATPSRVAGISGQGGFAFSLPAPRPIFEAEFLASLHGIGTYRPFTNNIHLIGDNLGVLFCLKRGSSRNLVANEFLKNLAYLWLKSPFFLTISYIKSADNPADFYTRHF